MGTTYINRITIKKDGVYLSMKGRGDRHYHSVFNPTLTDILETEGRESVDKEIIRMAYNYCTLMGDHESIKRYKFNDKKRRSSCINRSKWKWEIHTFKVNDKDNISEPREDRNIWKINIFIRVRSRFSSRFFR